jgi:hypothetical protein
MTPMTARRTRRLLPAPRAMVAAGRAEQLPPAFRYADGGFRVVLEIG